MNTEPQEPRPHRGDGAALVTPVAQEPPAPTYPRCADCGHYLSEHTPNGCDTSWCDCLSEKRVHLVTANISAACNTGACQDCQKAGTCGCACHVQTYPFNPDYDRDGNPLAAPGSAQEPADPPWLILRAGIEQELREKIARQIEHATNFEDEDDWPWFEKCAAIVRGQS